VPAPYLNLSLSSPSQSRNVRPGLEIVKRELEAKLSSKEIEAAHRCAKGQDLNELINQLLGRT